MRSARHGTGFAALLLLGCGAAPAAPSRAAETTPLVALESMDSDVWAFERVVEGRADEACARIDVQRQSEDGLRVLVEAVRSEGRFRASVPLREGENLLRARCALEGGGASDSDEVRWLVRLEERPRARVRVVVEDGSATLDLGASERSEGSERRLVSARWRTQGDVPLRTADGEPLADVSAMRITLRTPERDGEYVVVGEVTDAGGRSDAAAARFVVEAGRVRAIDPMREHALWIDEAVVYGAVPFLFGRPGLPAITARLDALLELGFDTIWLAPITESPEGDYGYAVTDYFEVRDAYGTREDLRALVDAAHARGMRVVMDFVPNHTSDEHPYFEHAREHGARSPYWGFYERDESGDHEHYFDWENLPNLDYDNPEVRRFMREAFSFWARELDVDGFRVDAVWGLERRAPEALAELAEELYRIDPSLLLIAEASACDPIWRRVGFAAGYDWTSAVGRWAWGEPFGIGEDDGGVDVPALRAAIVRSDAPECARVARFLDNNDTGERFVTRRGRALYEAALTMLLTLPGLPTIFTGAEIGAEYAPYEREEPLDWAAGDASAGRELARRIALRRSHEALQDGELTMLDAEPGGAVLAYLRHDEEGNAAPVLIVIELGGAPQRASVRIEGEHASAFAGRALRDALAGEDVSITRRGQALSFPLAAHGARVFVGR